MYDYKAMSVFVTVVEQGSMQATATKLAMTPSAVSQSIQKLESQLQIKLLNRTTRKLSLTEAGEAFYKYASLMQQSAENAVKSVELLRSSPIGVLNIACVTGLIDSLLMKAFKIIVDQHSDFNLNFFFEDKVIDLLEQRIDIALRAGEGALLDNMIARHIYDFDWAIVGHRSYFERNPAPQHIQQLGALDWINFANQRYATLHLSRNQEQIQLTPNYRVTCNSLYSSRQFTMNGFGVSIQPIDDIRPALASGELIQIFSDWKLPPVPLYLVTLQRIQSEKVRIVCDLISEYFKNLKP